MGVCLPRETVTSRYYGASESLLPHYAWYLMNSQNRTWPVASLKPNDYGLFDMQGNAWQWCDDAYRSYPRSNVSEDSGFTKPVVEADDRVLRGGAFDLIAVHVRSASRYKSAGEPELPLRFPSGQNLPLNFFCRLTAWTISCRPWRGRCRARFPKIDNSRSVRYK